jgi:hypothetical protein
MVNLKSLQQTLFRPRYTHACQQKPKPSRNAVPVSRKIIAKDKRIKNNFKTPVLTHICSSGNTKHRQDAACYKKRNRLRERKGR